MYNNPLEIWNYNNVNIFRYNIIGQILCIINTSGILFKFNALSINGFRIIPRKMPLIDIFRDDQRKAPEFIDQFFYPRPSDPVKLAIFGIFMKKAPEAVADPVADHSPDRAEK